mgnify:FL=1
MKSIIEVELELRGRECIATTEVQWRLKHCECTSTYGDDKNCVEKWDEVEIEGVEIECLQVLTDTEDEYRAIPLSSLTIEDLRCIKDLAGEQLMEEEL